VDAEASAFTITGAIPELGVTDSCATGGILMGDHVIGPDILFVSDGLPTAFT
jgi:hypothetical protein